MNPTAQPSDLLPPQMVASMVRGQADPNSLFQQNPLATGMTPNAMGADPSLMQQPPVGSQAMNPTMPSPQQGMQQPNAGAPGQQAPQMSESEMILQALMKRLDHHSSITSKTVNTITKMVEAGLPVDESQGNPPTA